MTAALFTGIVTALSPVLVVLFTWLTRRGLDRKAAEAKEVTDRLEQQRLDFQAIVEPLRTSLTTLGEANDTLKERVGSLERKTTRAERKTALVVKAFNQVLDYFHEKYQDPGPVLDRRVRELLEDG